LQKPTEYSDVWKSSRDYLLFAPKNNVWKLRDKEGMRLNSSMGIRGEQSLGGFRVLQSTKIGCLARSLAISCRLNFPPLDRLWRFHLGSDGLVLAPYMRRRQRALDRDFNDLTGQTG
jgi:hypothetical protein